MNNNTPGLVPAAITDINHSHEMRTRETIRTALTPAAAVLLNDMNDVATDATDAVAAEPIIVAPVVRRARHEAARAISHLLDASRGHRGGEAMKRKGIWANKRVACDVHVVDDDALHAVFDFVDKAPSDNQTEATASQLVEAFAHFASSALKQLEARPDDDKHCYGRVFPLRKRKLWFRLHSWRPEKETARTASCGYQSTRPPSLPRSLARAAPSTSLGSMIGGWRSCATGELSHTMRNIHL